MSYGILLVDPHKILRDGIKALLEQNTEFHVIGEAASGQDAVKLCVKLRPELVVMDIGLPGMNGIEATAEILKQSPVTKVIILSMYDDEESVVAAFRAGVRAFLQKKGSSADLLDALRTVAKGGSYLSSEVSDHLLNRIQNGDMAPRGLSAPLDSLSVRERQVLRLISEGNTSKDIAGILDLGVQTVRTYRKTLMKKLGVTNVAGLTHAAFASGAMKGAMSPGKPD